VGYKEQRDHCKQQTSLGNRGTPKPDFPTRKPATWGETIFALAPAIPAGWLGLPGKDRSLLKSPTPARDGTSRGERLAAL